MGALNLLGRDGTDAFVRGLIGGKPKVERVTKVEDLLPLLQMQRVDAIVLAAHLFPELRAASRLNLAERELATAWVCRRPPGGRRAPAVLAALKRLPGGLCASLGVDEWRYTPGAEATRVSPVAADLRRRGGGLSSAGRRLGSGSRYVELASSAPSHASKGTILVVMPETRQTREVWTGLSDELSPDYSLVAVRAEGSATADAIAEAVRRHPPLGIVLMNNPTVTAYRNFQHRSSDAKFRPPSS